MTKILITGKNSYVGNELSEWIVRKNMNYEVELVGMRDNEWRKKNFYDVDTVVHTAGIAHVSTNPKMKEQYFKVNRDLTLEVALKAKKSGVKQFIFLSSIIVFGNSKYRRSSINSETCIKPDNFYGESKLQAENELLKLEDDTFKIVIVRPPMIYGEGSKGNYPKLSKLAKFSPLFLKNNNKKSMIYVKNLCEFLYLLIKNNEYGTFHPQNNELVGSSILFNTIAKVNSKRVLNIEINDYVFNKLINKFEIFSKIFGDLYYEKKISEYKEKYNLFSFYESINLTEKKGK
ncbi:NAD-dependent epimerase/dehydratase family protein [Exiguobacterium sp. PHA03]|uniref:NAD-dependent epimerase/dehydratase family protein n=1 Tax=Exiguobacterium sp. PHA03 TaxID=3064895 RepID=UPI0035C06FC9